MKFIVHVDADNYVVGLELSTDEKAVEIPDEVYGSQNLTCWKYVDGKFTFDEEKKARLEAEEEQREEEEKLRPTVDDLAEALNTLTDIVLGGE